MIPYKQMRRIVKGTLDAMDTYRPTNEATIDLILMTFFHETGCEFLVEEETFPIRHGFMQMSKADVDEVIRDCIRPSEKNYQNVTDVSLVDVRNDTIEDLFEAAAYNIAFMTTLTYHWYLLKAGSLPETIEEAGEKYITHYTTAPMNTRMLERMLSEYITWTRED